MEFEEDTLAAGRGEQEGGVAQPLIRELGHLDHLVIWSSGHLVIGHRKIVRAPF